MTGASGFLGEHLLRALLAANIPTLGVIRSKQMDDLAASVVQVDLADVARVDALLESCRPHAVIHCAAATDVAHCQRQPDIAHSCNVVATASLVDAAQRHVPDAPFVLVSTDLVYDGTNPPYDEASAPQPLSIYAASKLASERFVLDHPRGCVVRAALMYGPPMTHKASFLGWMIQTLRQGRQLKLFEDEWRTPVFVDDLVAGLRAVARLGLKGLWVAGGPERLSRFAMGQIVADAFDFDRALLIRACLADSDYPAPRPADVSLRSDRFWQAIGSQPKHFAAAVQSCTRAFEPG